MTMLVGDAMIELWQYVLFLTFVQSLLVGFFSVKLLWDVLVECLVLSLHVPSPPTKRLS